MRTTITLEIDLALLQKAQAWADQHQITLSEAISNLLQRLPNPDSSPSLSPWIQSLTGVISVESLETAQTEYLDYLEEKYN
jgi:hypothetical protein